MNFRSDGLKFDLELSIAPDKSWGLVVTTARGAFAGIVGVASTVPNLHDLAGLFGIAQLVWFLWLGVVLLSARGK